MRKSTPKTFLPKVNNNLPFNMNAETLRNYCLLLPNVEERMPFGAFKWAQNILAFYVCGHLFCFYNIEKFNCITLKSTYVDELKARFSAAGKPINMNQKYWVGINPNNDITDKELLELVKQSYDIVKKQ